MPAPQRTDDQRRALPWTHKDFLYPAMSPERRARLDESARTARFSWQRDAETIAALRAENADLRSRLETLK